MKVMNILMMVQGLKQMTMTLLSQLGLICFYKDKGQEKLQKKSIRLIVNKIIMTYKDKTNTHEKKFNILNLTKYQKIKIEILMT